MSEAKFIKVSLDVYDVYGDETGVRLGLLTIYSQPQNTIATYHPFLHYGYSVLSVTLPGQQPIEASAQIGQSIAAVEGEGVSFTLGCERWQMTMGLDMAVGDGKTD